MARKREGERDRQRLVIREGGQRTVYITVRERSGGGCPAGTGWQLWVYKSGQGELGTEVGAQNSRATHRQDGHRHPPALAAPLILLLVLTQPDLRPAFRGTGAGVRAAIPPAVLLQALVPAPPELGRQRPFGGECVEDARGGVMAPVLADANQLIRRDRRPPWVTQGACKN